MVSEVGPLPWESLVSPHSLVTLAGSWCHQHTLWQNLSLSHLWFSEDNWKMLGLLSGKSSTATVVSLSEDFSSSFNHWFWQHLYLGALSDLWIMSKESCIRQEVKSLITRQISSGLKPANAAMGLSLLLRILKSKWSNLQAWKLIWLHFPHITSCFLVREWEGSVKNLLLLIFLRIFDSQGPLSMYELVTGQLEEICTEELLSPRRSLQR